MTQRTHKVTLKLAATTPVLPYKGKRRSGIKRKPPRLPDRSKK